MTSTEAKPTYYGQMLQEGKVLMVREKIRNKKRTGIYGFYWVRKGTAGQIKNGAIAYPETKSFDAAPANEEQTEFYDDYCKKHGTPPAEMDYSAMMHAAEESAREENEKLRARIAELEANQKKPRGRRKPQQQQQPMEKGGEE